MSLSSGIFSCLILGLEYPHRSDTFGILNLDLSVLFQILAILSFSLPFFALVALRLLRTLSGCVPNPYWRESMACSSFLAFVPLKTSLLGFCISFSGHLAY